MKRETKDFSEVKSSITGKTIREMSWEETLWLASKSKPMTQEEALRQFRAVRAKYLKSKSS